MGWFGGLVGKMLGGGVGAAAEGIAGAIDRFVETKEEKKAAEMLLMKIQQEPDRWQTEINKIEAGHRSMFVAGWRPAIGWVCALGLGWHFLVQPFAATIISILVGAGIVATGAITLPVLSIGLLMDLVIAMLGLGALRSYEKKNNLTK